MSHESKEIPESADHITPGSWQGNVKLKDISLQTSWNRGWRIIEQEFEGLKHILHQLDNSDSVDILSPFGTLPFDVPLADDDINESLIAPSSVVTSGDKIDDEITGASAHNIDMRVDVEDELGTELACLMIVFTGPVRWTGKKDRNKTEPDCKRPDHRLRLHKF